jgi:hypothetical protein
MYLPTAWIHLALVLSSRNTQNKFFYATDIQIIVGGSHFSTDYLLSQQKQPNSFNFSLTTYSFFTIITQ